MLQPGEKLSLSRKYQMWPSGGFPSINAPFMIRRGNKIRNCGQYVLLETSVGYTTASTSTSPTNITDNNKLIEDEMMKKLNGNPQKLRF